MELVTLFCVLHNENIVSVTLLVSLLSFTIQFLSMNDCTCICWNAEYIILFILTLLFSDFGWSLAITSNDTTGALCTVCFHKSLFYTMSTATFLT
jgi:hypothetical protein